MRLLRWFACVAFVGLLAFHADAQEIKHRFLATDESGKQLIHVDERAPENNWVVNIGSNRDIQLIDAERVIISNDRGYREYEIKTGKLLKEINVGARICSVIRTEEGHTFLANPQEIIELDENDKEIRKININMGGFLRLLRMSKDGHFLYTASQTSVGEADSSGKVLRSIDLKALDSGTSKPYFLMQMENGNFMASSGYGASLLELDRDGKLIRNIGGRDSVEGVFLNFFASTELLKNGNILVANWTGHGREDSRKGPQLVEFDKDGKIVWTWHDADMAGSLHGVVVID